MRIKRENSQLLIINMQRVLLDLMDDQDLLVERAVRLTTAAHRLEIPTLFAEQSPERHGNTVSDLKSAAHPDTQAVAKTHFSCLGNEILNEQIEFNKNKGLNQVVVAGIEAHICVTQTVSDLQERGYQTFVAADAISSRDDESWDLALDRMARCGAEIVDSEMIVYEWLEKSGTPEFKELHELVK